MRTSNSTWSLLLLGLVAFAPGCATTRPPITCGAAPGCADVVFVANGSGDYRTTSASLCQAARETGVPLRVETFVWSCGTGRIVADHVDHCNHLEQGRRLAGLVAADRQAYPDRAVSLLAHSTGCAVALAAAECLPPDSVERIVLLAPSVSADYDLRPALRSARQGIDVFVSRRDIGALGIGMGIVGTADRRWGPVAGRVGFAPVVTTPADEALYTRLHVHPWEPCLEWTGNRGGHFGATRPEYVRAYLLPLFLRKPCPPPTQ